VTKANKIKVDIANKLIPFASKDKRIKIVVGGRGSAKSTGLSDLIAAHVHNGLKVGCGREMQNSIDDSVHSTIKSSIERLGIPGFNVLQTNIRHESGGSVFYKGLARNPDSIKSVEGTDIFWCEEAQSLSEESLEKLIPTIRKSAGKTKMPELWFSANRGSSKDAFSRIMLKPFEKQLKAGGGYYEDDMRIIIELNWRDNPWFKDSGLNEQRLEDKKHMSAAKYAHVWEGEYNDDVENSIISSDWFDACVDAHEKLGFKPRGAEVVTFDPADSEGGDAKGLAYRHGVVFLDVQEWQQGDVNTALDKALDYSNKRRVDRFIWDGDGMGAPLRRDVSKAFEGKHTDWSMFKGSEGVDRPNTIYLPQFGGDRQQRKTNKQTFKNKRAQFYIELRDRVYRTYEAVVKDVYHDPDTLISFSSKIEGIDLLRSELCRIPEQPNPAGYIQIMSKDKMKQMKIESPNMADSVMMSFLTPKTQQTVLDVMPAKKNYNR